MVGRFGLRALAGRQVAFAPYGGRRGQDVVLPFISDFASTVPAGFVGGGVTPAPSVVLTANSSAHTFGAWTQVVASTAFESSALIVGTNNFNTSTVATGSVIDIGIGASGSEVSLMQIAVGSHNTYQTVIPIRIPAGTRIAARIQSVVTGGKTGQLHYGLLPVLGDFVSAPTVDVYGVDLATSRGVGITSVNTWTEITSSTTQAYRGMCVVISASNDTQANANIVFQLGVGASGSETVLGYGRVRQVATEAVLTDVGQFPFLYNGNIPAGSRIVVQLNNSSTTFDACVIGIPYA
jgi:hypothetical protein